jgi:hypothetical protein
MRNSLFRIYTGAGDKIVTKVRRRPIASEFYSDEPLIRKVY